MVLGFRFSIAPHLLGSAGFPAAGSRHSRAVAGGELAGVNLIGVIRGRAPDQHPVARLGRLRQEACQGCEPVLLPAAAEERRQKKVRE
jgi:hypothetical protein